MMHCYLLDPEGFTSGAQLPLSDRGFRYGMSVFETIAIRNGKPLLLDAHLQKLHDSVERVRFRPPLHWPEATREILAAPPVHEGMARIYVTAGDGGASLEVARSRVALMIEESEIPAPVEVDSAAALSLPFIPSLPPGKTGNYWQHLIAHANAGTSHAILVTPEGSVAGSAMANFFVIIGGKILTPESHGDIRHGAVYSWLTANFPVHETHLTLTDLENIEDAFLTNSRIGVLRIARLDDVTLAGSPLVDEIWSRYRSDILDGKGG